MRCPRDPAYVANTSEHRQSVVKARAQASVDHPDPPSVFGRSTRAIRSRSPAMRSRGSHPVTQEVRHEYRGDFRDSGEPG